MSLYNKTAHELHELLQTKKISATELTDEIFSHILLLEEDINAYITLTKEKAEADAKAVDEKISRGEKIFPLEGIPCAVKDNICTKGIRTTCASKILENFVPPYDATAYKKLSEQNPILIGKANLDEFAMGGSTENSGFHITRNPHNLEYVPGGSSGGSAAAVAGGEAIFALGSDTGGSIRQPRRWTQADLWSRVKIWIGCLCVVPRPNRSDNPRRDRLRTCSECYCRS